MRDANEERIMQMVREAISDALPPGILTEDERRWVRLAIQRQEQSIRLRQAIIEKTLAGLIWAGILGLGAVVLEYLRAHGLKP